MDDPWRPYVDGDPACQPQRLRLDATTPPRAPASLISTLELSLLSAFVLGELRRESAASPELSSPSPAKPASQMPSQSLLYLVVTSLATVEHG